MNGLSDFVSRPFREDMDIVNWIMFTILIVTVTILWSSIFRHFYEE